MNAVWKSPFNASFEGSAKSVVIIVSALRSATVYDYRFIAEYAQSYEYDGIVYSYTEQFFQTTQQIRTKGCFLVFKLFFQSTKYDYPFYEKSLETHFR